ncbi:hypothetical protein AGMMS50262_23660 [Bacteroidia bacterium]|nr:hypothetical protein AGMMS50262_23660 [Bacteroidia bacterium]
MYFKVSMRYNPAKSFIDGYYRLVESYRNVEDRICHRTILNVGFFDTEVKAEQLNRIQKILTRQCESSQPGLFEETAIDDPVVRSYVDILYNILVSENKIDTGTISKSGGREWQTIDLNSLRNKDVRDIGAEWICYQAIEQLKLSECLSKLGWDDQDIRLALTHIISRAVYPASEMKTSRWIKENSSVCEITGFPKKEITKDQLYRISKLLYAEKENIENHLSLRTNFLFDIEDKIILYDLTNTYFEGRMVHSKIARFGRSKEKRSDAKLIVLALVVNPEGFIKYSGILEGNVSDASTLEKMINELRVKTSSSAKRAIIVIDAGISTEANLAMIKEEGYDYICVSRSALKDFKLAANATQVTVTDNKKQKIVLQKVSSSKNEDYYLQVESESKEKKERSMNDRFRDGFETGLKKIALSLEKKGGVKQEEKVYERIGRLKQKYPSIHRYFDIKCKISVETKKIKKKGNEPEETTEKRIVSSIRWTIKEDEEINSRSGVYFLRTCIQDTEKIIWETYNTLREIEYTNRVLKTDLDLRPVYHKKDESSMAHLHLGLLAYWVVNTIRYQLKKGEPAETTTQAKALTRTETESKSKAKQEVDGETKTENQKGGIRFEWREIVRIMSAQKAVTTLAQNKFDEVILIRRCTCPDEKVKMIYDKLKYKYAPYKKKKSVVHKMTFEKNHPADFVDINSA